MVLPKTTSHTTNIDITIATNISFALGYLGIIIVDVKGTIITYSHNDLI